MHPITVTPEQCISDVELARTYGCKVSTIRKWRILGRGPKFIKLGSLVRYRVRDVNEFLDHCQRGSHATP